MLRLNVVLTTLGLLICLFGCACSYVIAAPVPYHRPYAYVPDGNIAAAKASASKIQSVNWSALDQYGHQIGQPLLVRDYGPLTSLYSALAPKRSFVGTIDSGFYKDSYGNVKFRDETAIGAIAI